MPSQDQKQAGRSDVDSALGRSVVIEAVESMTGAESIAPTHRGRGPDGDRMYVPTPASSLAGHADTALHHEISMLLYRQAALLDAKRWQDWIDLFGDDGVYWMPVQPGQNDWESQPSIFAEDKLLMEIRMGRLSHPNAWSQAAQWGTNHLVGNIVVESVASGAAGSAADGGFDGIPPLGEPCIVVASRFQMMELRRDEIRHFGGTYRHFLVRTPQGLRIRLQRVDLMNGQAAYDYVLQAWV
ncbi:MAG: aromatic-ring-hydroxylating dioxygenase subunit beta [Lautropia sp.]